MERVAIPIWQGRVSPVLDTAEKLWICEVDSARQVTSRLVETGPVDFRRRVLLLNELGVHTLICGALSRPLHNLLLSAGIAVRPWASGLVEDVLSAYMAGQLERDTFRLPGCRCGRKRNRAMRNRGNRS